MTSELMIAPVVGRYISGDVWVPQTKDMKGKELTNKSGEAMVKYYAAIAYSKQDPTAMQWIEQIREQARIAMPQHHHYPNFAWKIIDGDTDVDNKGKPWREKDGFAGHMVIRCTSSFPPQLVDENANTISEDQKDRLKRGYFVRMGISVAGNNDPDRPGVFLNLTFMQFIAYGEEIRGGVDVAGVLESAGTVALPPGASATPVATGTPVPSTPGATPTAPPPTGASTAPNAPAVPSGPVMTQKAQGEGLTYEALKANNWTDEQMVQHGYLQPSAPNTAFVNNA